MKNIFLPIGFLLGLAMAGSPFVSGMIIKSESNAFIEQLNQSTGYKAEWVSYQTGWLSSQGKLHIGFDFPGTENSPELKAFMDKLTLEFDADIHHGPFLKKNGLGWAAWSLRLKQADALRQYIDWESGTPLYQISGTLGLNGEVEYNDSIPVLKSATPGATMAFGGYRGHGDIGGGAFTYKGKSGSIEIHSPLATIHVDPIEMNMTADDDFDAMFSNGLYNTSGNLLIPKIRTTGTALFELEDFEIKYDLDLSNDRDSADIRFGYLIDAVNVGEHKVNDIAIELAVENYSAAFHKQYMQFAQDMAYKGAQADPEVMQAFMTDTLPLLLEMGPAFKLTNLSFSLPSGNFSSKFEIKLEPISALPTNLEDPGFWMEKISADADLSADQALVDEIGTLVLSQQIAQSAATESFILDEETGDIVEGPQLTPEEITNTAAQQLQQYLGMAQGMGFIVLDGSTYKSKLEYDQGKVQVNNQAFALPF